MNCQTFPHRNRLVALKLEFRCFFTLNSMASCCRDGDYCKIRKRIRFHRHLRCLHWLLHRRKEIVQEHFHDNLLTKVSSKLLFISSTENWCNLAIHRHFVFTAGNHFVQETGGLMPPKLFDPSIGFPWMIYSRIPARILQGRWKQRNRTSLLSSFYYQLIPI